MPRQRVDADAMKRAMVSIRMGQDTVRSAAAKFHVHWSFLCLQRLNVKVPEAATIGLATALSADEELVIVDLFLYAGGLHLGI